MEVEKQVLLVEHSFVGDIDFLERWASLIGFEDEKNILYFEFDNIVVEMEEDYIVVKFGIVTLNIYFVGKMDY